jgi:hypothetical protein
MAVDITKVPVGSWGDYKVTAGDKPPMGVRMALVNKGVVEIAGEVGGPGAKATVQIKLAPGGEKDGKVQQVMMQIGANDPMSLPPGADQQPFSKPDPKTLIKEESVTVKGGTFKAKHYREKTPKGDVVDYWVSDKVLPLGLVKLETEQKANPQISGLVRFELVGTGKDAKPIITKPAKPFDQAAMIQQMMGSMAKPGAGAPPAAPPAPPKK